MSVASVWILDKRSMAEGGTSPAEIKAMYAVLAICPGRVAADMSIEAGHAVATGPAMPVASVWILDKRSMAEGGASPAEIEAAAETARRDASALARLKHPLSSRSGAPTILSLMRHYPLTLYPGVVNKWNASSLGREKFEPRVLLPLCAALSAKTPGVWQTIGVPLWFAHRRCLPSIMPFQQAACASGK